MDFLGFDHSDKTSSDCHMTRMAGEVTRFLEYVRQGIFHKSTKLRDETSAAVPYHRQSTLSPLKT